MRAIEHISSHFIGSTGMKSVLGGVNTKCKDLSAHRSMMLSAFI